MTGATIFALSSGPGRTGVAVWRVSGPLAGAVATALAGPLPPPRHAALRTLRQPDGSIIDKGLVLWFPAPKSETGEDMVEFHSHGGRGLALCMTSALTAAGAVLAQPGEFTRRAVVNGKLDLTAAEAMADLVAADTEHQRRGALAQASGVLERRVAEWRERLIRAAGHLEAMIDFPDEEIPASVGAQLTASVAALAQDIADALEQSARGEMLRGGLRVALVGAPNAGKSSLLNGILGRDAAMVSEVAGTTRDVIEAHLDLGGWPVVVADTAGLRDTEDGLEAEGVRRARAWAETAQVRLVVIDGARLPYLDQAALEMIGPDSLVVVNKGDLAASIPDTIGGQVPLVVSALTGEGIDRVLKGLEAMAEDRMTGSEGVFGRARHRAALSEAAEALGRFDLDMGPELAAEDLRLAARSVGRITGAIQTDDVLDVVFRDFCIGK